ncbi:hypothetical protein V5799_015968 [Amblyomma americanum]|uniref:GB1/RHD3-type G domain-containing protein n=1 Tax=Amblyomma americanum TaxID=6943 RepID=A0AAQ4F6D3_AMBAM
MAQGPSSGRAVAVLKCMDDGSFELDIEALEEVLLAEHIWNIPVAVISVAGSFRRGKSFLLNFFIQYLRNQCRGDWLRKCNTSLDGFAWRGGSERETKGILLWSEVFVVTTSKGEKVAVVLMDTQGTFDGTTTMKGTGTIFALSTMLSSVQVYNLSQNIGEDDLQHLALFCDYGQVVKKDGSNNAFQTLLFLVRDWSFPYEFRYGAHGGRAYMEKRLEVCDEQPEELRNLRRDIRSSFEEIACFLMPHPGLKVATNPEFKGCLSDIDIDFKNHLEKLLAVVLHPVNLFPKKINNCIITCEKLLMYFKVYAESFKNGEASDPMSIREATGVANNTSALTDALQYYLSEMAKACADTPCAEHHLRKSHEEGFAAALRKFDAVLKLGGKEMEAAVQDKACAGDPSNIR